MLTTLTPPPTLSLDPAWVALPVARATVPQDPSTLVEHFGDMFVQPGGMLQPYPGVAEKFASACGEALTVGDPSTAIDRQLKISSAYAIHYWKLTHVPRAQDLRLTDDPAAMLARHGKSFFDEEHARELVGIAEKDGDIGLYHRWQGIAKLGGNIYAGYITDAEALAAARERAVLYTIIGGWMPPHKGIREATESGRVSPIYRTTFLHTFVPGTTQFASTGAGHSQNDLLDVKYVTTGRGLQINIEYDEYERARRVILQEMSPGRMVYSYPNSVDYVVNYGWLSFDDVSIRLGSDEIERFSASRFGGHPVALPGVAPILYGMSSQGIYESHVNAEILSADFRTVTTSLGPNFGYLNAFGEAWYLNLQSQENLSGRVDLALSRLNAGVNWTVGWFPPVR